MEIATENEMKRILQIMFVSGCTSHGYIITYVTTVSCNVVHVKHPGMFVVHVIFFHVKCRGMLIAPKNILHHSSTIEQVHGPRLENSHSCYVC